jgi:hypothetical protein
MLWTGVEVICVGEGVMWSEDREDCEEAEDTPLDTPLDVE